MKRNIVPAICFLVGMLFTVNASAEDFDFELGIAFDRTNTDFSSSFVNSGITTSLSGLSDTDNVSVFGSWYFAGLSDESGPRARAVLVDRASSLRFNYTRSTQTNASFLSNDDPVSPILSDGFTIDSEGDAFEIDLRYVDRDSGWFGNVGLLTSDTALGGVVRDSFDATGWRLGFGRYVLENTTLAFDYSQINTDGGPDATGLSFAIEHLGGLGDRWQYAVDLGYSHVDTNQGIDQNSWRAALALYPNEDFEFGVAVEDTDISFSQDTTSIDGFASWFVKPNVRVSAFYRIDDLNSASDSAFTSSDADTDRYGINATIRF